MGHVVGLKMCVSTLSCILNITPRAQGLSGQQWVLMDLGVRLVRIGLARANVFSKPKLMRARA